MSISNKYNLSYTILITYLFGPRKGLFVNTLRGKKDSLLHDLFIGIGIKVHV